MEGEKTPVRVLVADDEDDIRSWLELMISNEESLELVGAAADAEEAVRLAVETRPDAVVLDWIMPGGGGYAAKEINDRVPEARVIAFTAADTMEASYDMLHAGAVGLLAKGCPSEELVRAIHSAVKF